MIVNRRASPSMDNTKPYPPSSPDYVPLEAKRGQIYFLYSQRPLLAASCQ